MTSPGRTTNLFLSPHPDDAALSCGGLIAGLRARGEPVAILTVFNGAGPLPRLTPYQRLALGFGESGGGAGGSDAAPTPGQIMAVRRAEDEGYARLVGASIAFLNLPDAVFRGYEGDDQLMGEPRLDDLPPVEELRAALAEARPRSLYVPLSVGGHVDHRQVRRAAIELLAGLASARPDRVLFYEDFPYALTIGFERLDQLDPEIVESLPGRATLIPEYVGLGTLIDRKVQGLAAYESQLGRLFGAGGGSDDDPVGAAVRARAARIGELGGTGPAERYWRLTTT